MEGNMSTATTEITTSTTAITNGMNGTEDTSLFMCIYYMSMGAIALLCNLVSLHVFAGTKELRKKFMYFIALDLGELVNSISFILTGSGRLNLLLHNKLLDTPMTAHQCFFETFWVHTLIVGTELTTFMLVLIAFERICAVMSPSLYNRVFTASGKKNMMIGAFTMTLFSLILATISAYNNTDTVLTAHCPIINSTALWYSTMHNVFLVVGHVVSLTSLIIVQMCTQKFARESHRRSTEASKISLLIAFTGSSTVLVMIPSAVLIGIRWNLWTLDDLPVSLSYSLTAMISIATCIINFIMREEFRRALRARLESVGLKKKSILIQHSFRTKESGMHTHTNTYTH